MLYCIIVCYIVLYYLIMLYCIILYYNTLYIVVFASWGFDSRIGHARQGKRGQQPLIGV